MDTLKPHDIVVLLKLVALRRTTTIAEMSSEIFISASEIYAALNRAQQARLVDARRIVKIEFLQEFILHGLPFVFYFTPGQITRGVPTSIAAPPLVGKYFDSPELPPVWPNPNGTVRGYTFEPLHKKVPEAAAADSALYELLALVDAIREGNPRAKPIAIRELEQRFSNYTNYARTLV